MGRFIFAFVFLFAIAPAFAGQEKSQLRFYDAELNQYTDAPGIATEIDVEISGTIGRAKVIQYFANDTDTWREGKYTYPLPDDAAVDRLVMVIGERRILGFVAQKEKARQIYEQAKTEGKATSLVEQHRDNIFHTSVANIPPRSLIAIEIGYQFDVAVDSSVFSMRMPMAVTPRFDHFEPEEFLTLASAQESRASRALAERLALFDFKDGKNPFSLRVSLDPGFALSGIKSPSHEIKHETDEDGLIRIKTAEKILKGGQDFVLEWAPQETGEPLGFLHSEEIDGKFYSHLVVMPPQDAESFTAKSVKPRQVTLIIDVSGSMGGPSIRQAKAALIEAIEDLSPGDYFSVISFESQTRWLFDAPVPADKTHKKKAVKWVAGLDAGGGTHMLPALERALGEEHIEGKLRQIVFITDGAIGYEGRLGAYIRDHVGAARFYAVGIGAAPNAHLMRLIAAGGRGTFTFIGNVKETEEKMGALFKKMRNPVLSGLVLHMPDDIAAEIIPAKIPDLMAGEPVSLAIKSDKALHELSLSGWRGDQNWTHEIALPGELYAAGVGRIYARRKIRELKFSDPAGQKAETEAQITALGTGHQIMSDYTSFVAVDEKTIRPQGQALSFRRYDPNHPKGWQLAEFDPREAAGAYDEYLQKIKENAKTQNDRKHDIDLPQTASNWMIRLFLSLLMLISGLFMWRGRYRSCGAGF